MIPYIISAPDHRTSSAGIRALHLLCKILNDNCCEAYITSKSTIKGSKSLYGNDPKLKQMIIDGAIAVYPEISLKNYLWSKNPVGWLLNSGKFEFEREGLIFTFQKTYGDYETLCLTEIEDFFNNEHNYKRKYNSVYVGKGRADERMDVVKDRVLITYKYPKDRRKLAEILKQSKALYNFDANSMINAEARLCGCPVVILENGNNNLGFFDKVVGGKLGVTNDESKIEQIKEGIVKYTDIIRNIIKNNEAEVLKFIRLTQLWAEARNARAS